MQSIKTLSYGPGYTYTLIFVLIRWHSLTSQKELFFLPLSMWTSLSGWSHYPMLLQGLLSLPPSNPLCITTDVNFRELGSTFWLWGTKEAQHQYSRAARYPPHPINLWTLGFPVPCSHPLGSLFSSAAAHRPSLWAHSSHILPTSLRSSIGKENGPPSHFTEAT